jgi:hypothetical protein
LESLLLSARACFLWGASSGTPCISPNQNVNKIMEFIHENLHIYTIAGSALLNQNLHQLPMILSGDFNIDFSTENSKPLIDFLKTIGFKYVK